GQIRFLQLRTTLPRSEPVLRARESEQRVVRHGTGIDLEISESVAAEERRTGRRQRRTDEPAPGRTAALGKRYVEPAGLGVEAGNPCPRCVRVQVAAQIQRLRQRTVEAAENRESVRKFHGGKALGNIRIKGAIILSQAK